ncbi:unnamed protein product [Cylicocyclus nassatus]|uniref:Uncharacterized protein n=1 Tax=Cylicocyclus nassatus TaxID=53992 RepID=A0AA36DUW5_CYLNA|nr:unnamed protein product [Cylicocyclus nassatus]
MSIKEEDTQPEDAGTADAQTKLDGSKTQTSAVKQETSDAHVEPKTVPQKAVGVARLLVYSRPPRARAD